MHLSVPTGSLTPAAARENMAFLIAEPPQITPLQFLFISSPTLRKIVYVQLRNFHAVGNMGLPLIDSGLVEPCGLAFDGVHGGLYVADRGQQSIIRYAVRVKRDSADPSRRIVEAGQGVVVLQGRDVEWVSVDVRGDVFYSDPINNNIGRIPLSTINELAFGTTSAELLSFVSMKDVQAGASGSSAANQTAQATLHATPAAIHILDQPRTVYVLYEGSVNPNVGTPGGVASDGRHLFWTNTNGGLESGTVCTGDLAPQLATPGADHYEARALGNNSDHGYGLAKTNLMVVFTASSGANTGGVYGVYDSGAGGVQAFSTSMSQPRGIAWDGDGTVYVADAGSGKVHSVPVGRLMNNAPMEDVIDFSGAYGLALINSESPAFVHIDRSGAPWRHTSSCASTLDRKSVV